MKGTQSRFIVTWVFPISMYSLKEHFWLRLLHMDCSFSSLRSSRLLCVLIWQIVLMFSRSVWLLETNSLGLLVVCSKAGGAAHGSHQHYSTSASWVASGTPHFCSAASLVWKQSWVISTEALLALTSGVWWTAVPWAGWVTQHRVSPQEWHQCLWIQNQPVTLQSKYLECLPPSPPR